MNEENQNIPPAPLPELPSEEDARQEVLKELEPYLLRADRNYPEPFYLLEYNGVPFSPLGGLQAVSGQKKNGKKSTTKLYGKVGFHGMQKRERVNKKNAILSA